MGRPRKFLEEQIIPKAFGLFHGRSYESVSVSNIVEALGINRSSIYGAFTDKRSLYIKVLQNELASSALLVERLLPQTSAEPIGDLRNFFSKTVETIAKNPDRPGCIVTNAIAEHGSNDVDVIQIANEYRYLHLRAMERVLTRAQMLGQLPPGEPTQRAATLFTSYIGMQVQGRMGLSQAELGQLAQLALSHVGLPS